MASKTLSELALGTWDSGTSYTIGDIVDNGGSSYVCIANSTNNEPPNTTYWALLASKGDTGATGSTGATGATGPMGPSGAVGVTGTPVDNQLAVWTSATEVEGDSALTFDTTDDTLSTGILNATSLTASEIVGTNADKDLVSLAVATYPSLTELTYVKGVTSAIQTQLGDKAPLASPSFTGTVTTAGNIELGHATDTTLSRSAAGVLAVEGNDVAFKNTTINAQTGTTYTLVIGDASKFVSMSNVSANTLTVPPNSSVAFPTGTKIMVQQLGAGSTTIAAGAGVTINAPASVALGIAEQYGSRGLIKTATDTWELI